MADKPAKAGGKKRVAGGLTDRPGSKSVPAPPEVPDLPKSPAPFSIPELPDYSKLLAGFVMPEMPDYSKLFAGFVMPEMSDYSKLFAGFAMPELPDYSKLLGGIEMPEWSKLTTEMPDYSKLFGGTVVPGPASWLRKLSSPSLLSSTVNPLIDSSAETAQLLDEIRALRKAATEHAKALTAATAGSEEQKREIDQLKMTVEQLNEKQRLGFLLQRLHPDAHRRLQESAEFREKFLATGECSAFVLSVDIRRSTELMLKSRNPEKFAAFITRLCDEMTLIVLNSLGVLDKFTGDGILAFFPDFYSGPDAAYRVVAAADSCHAAFQRLYCDSRTSFKSVLTDVGLGIGIDFGVVRLVKVADGLTVVGEPVVYACRLAGAPPNITLANQPAFEQISSRFGGFCFVEERSHEIKHEGAVLAYHVQLNGQPHVPALPEWAVKGSPTNEPE